MDIENHLFIRLVIAHSGRSDILFRRLEIAKISHLIRAKVKQQIPFKTGRTQLRMGVLPRYIINLLLYCFPKFKAIR